MYQVLKEIHFSYAHRLLDYEGNCASLHGHNGRIQVTLARENLDERGMVFEFSELRVVLQKWVDEVLDHRTILRHDDPLAKLLEEIGEPIYLMQENPTAEALAREIFCYAEKQGLPVSEVRLWETDSSCAAYSKN